MRSSSCANPLVTVQTIQASSQLFPDMAYERHLRDVLALHKPRNDFDVAATASTAGVVSANTGPFSRLRSAAGPAIRLQVSPAQGLSLESDCMARTCTICSHPKLVNIDRQLLRGDMLNGIAHRFHVSPDAVGRHRRHMRTAMLKVQAAAEKQDLVYGQTLIEEVKAIKADAERLQLEAEGRRDIRAAPGNPRARGDRRVAGEADGRNSNRKPERHAEPAN